MLLSLCFLVIVAGWVVSTRWGNPGSTSYPAVITVEEGCGAGTGPA
jgi:hypothetical protein